MQQNLKDIQKITDLLRKFQPHTSVEDLEKIAQDLLELGLFLVRLRVKEHSQSLKQEEIEIRAKPP